MMDHRYLPALALFLVAVVAAYAVSDDSAPTYGKPAKVDPVKQNGPIFTDPNWDKIEMAIVISGEQLGYLEPCGCAGLENQKGGYKRRDTLIGQLRQRGWPLVLLDAGGLVRRYGPQQEIKYEAALRGLRTMGYNAIAFGNEDLQLSTEALVAAGAEDANPFLAANVKFNPDTIGEFPLGKPSMVLEAGGIKVGVTAVLGDKFRENIRNPDLIIKPAAEALTAVLPDLRKQCDIVIVLAYAPKEETAELARKFQEIDLIVTAGGAEEPPASPQKIEGCKKTRMIEVGHKGMYAAVIGLAKADPAKKYAGQKLYQRVPLDARFPDSPAMQKLMVDYQANLEAAGLAALCPPPVVHPRGQNAADPRGQFVGSETCGGCHTKAHAKWATTGHAHATESLEKIASPPRLNDPECLSCHVTGWNPQEYFAYKSGFESVEATPHLVANGCENCHGPGAAHVAAQESDAPDAAEIRALMRLTKEQAEKKVCITCHDGDNSPDFNFEEYWKQIAHPGRD